MAWWWGFLLSYAGTKKAPSGATSRATAAAARLPRFAREEKARNPLPAIRPHHTRMDTSADAVTQTEDDTTALATRRLTVRAYADHIAQPNSPNRRGAGPARYLSGGQTRLPPGSANV